MLPKIIITSHGVLVPSVDHSNLIPIISTLINWLWPFLKYSWVFVEIIFDMSNRVHSFSKLYFHFLLYKRLFISNKLLWVNPLDHTRCIHIHWAYSILQHQSRMKCFTGKLCRANSLLVFCWCFKLRKNYTCLRWFLFSFLWMLFHVWLFMCLSKFFFV